MLLCYQFKKETEVFQIFGAMKTIDFSFYCKKLCKKLLFRPEQTKVFLM